MNSSGLSTIVKQNISNRLKKLFLILLLFPLAICGQKNQDSLWSVWSDMSQHDTNRINALHHYAWSGYLGTQPDSAIYFAKIELELSTSKNYIPQKASAQFLYGLAYFSKGNYDEAIEKFESAIDNYDKSGNKPSLAKALRYMGIAHESISNYQTAIVYLNKSLTIVEELQDSIGISSTLNSIGIVYLSQGNYSSAIENLVHSLNIKEAQNDTLGAANSLNNIGIIYTDQEEYDAALPYHQKALALSRAINNTRSTIISLINIGSVIHHKGDYEKALIYYKKGYKESKKLGKQRMIASAANNIGLLYREQGNYKKAIPYLDSALNQYLEIGNSAGQSLVLDNLARCYLKLGEYNKAKNLAEKSLDLSLESGAIRQTKDASFSLFEINKALKNYTEALTMYELHTSSRDSILSDDNQQEIIRQNFKYTYEKQATADSITNAEAQKVKDALLLAEKAENKHHKIEAHSQKQFSYFLYAILGLALLFGGFIFNRFRVANKQKGIIEEQKEKVDEAFDELGEKNKEILDSINYAKRIQNAILPPSKVVKEYLQESFILYKPKDIVAGDFYWLEHIDGKVLFAAADCTGHGVPGAMVSVVCNNGLNRSVREHKLTDPGLILDKTREIVIAEFEKSEDEVKDGMDIALCSLEGNKLEYAGAHNPLWIIRNGKVLETKANKQPIGKFDKQTAYTTHTFELEKGDSIYIFSDGYVDQFGGIKGKKFKSKAFRELLLSIQDKTMEEQRVLIDEAFETWRGSLEQIDDVCVIGVRV